MNDKKNNINTNIHRQFFNSDIQRHFTNILNPQIVVNKYAVKSFDIQFEVNGLC